MAAFGGWLAARAKQRVAAWLRRAADALSPGGGAASHLDAWRRRFPEAPDEWLRLVAEHAPPAYRDEALDRPSSDRSARSLPARHGPRRANLRRGTAHAASRRAQDQAAGGAPDGSDHSSPGRATGDPAGRVAAVSSDRRAPAAPGGSSEALSGSAQPVGSHRRPGAAGEAERSRRTPRPVVRFARRPEPIEAPSPAPSRRSGDSATSIGVDSAPAGGARAPREHDARAASERPHRGARAPTGPSVRYGAAPPGANARRAATDPRALPTTPAASAVSRPGAAPRAARRGGSDTAHERSVTRAASVPSELAERRFERASGFGVRPAPIAAGRSLSPSSPRDRPSLPPRSPTGARSGSNADRDADGAGASSFPPWDAEDPRPVRLGTNDPWPALPAAPTGGAQALGRMAEAERMQRLIADQEERGWSGSLS